MNIGKTVSGRYLIKERIGSGGFGTVWLAADNESGGYAAIKQLKHKWLRSFEMVNCFKNEFNLLKQLPHENTIRPFELVSANSGYLIVMEYLDGGSLSQRIRRTGVLEIETAVFITVRMLKVLNESNRLKIVHRDIKPSNILFAGTGLETPKLGDFGLAYLSAGRICLPAQNIHAHSQTMGTLAYMPPEQLSGKRLNIKSDIYSLGMTLYKMVAGRLPFGEGFLDSGGVKRSILHPFREHPGRYRPEIQFWLDDLIMRMIAARIYERPGSPREVLDVIEKNMKTDG